MNTYMTRPEYEKDWKEFSKEHRINHWIMEWEKIAPLLYLPVVYFKTTMTLDEINALPLSQDQHRIIDNLEQIDPNNFPTK